MITRYILDTETKKLARSEEATSDFIGILKPNREELGQMSTVFGFPFDYLGGILDDYENARFETDKKGNQLLLLQYPAISEETGEIETYPFSLVVTGKSLIFTLNHRVDLTQVLERNFEVKVFQHQLLFDIVRQMTQTFQDFLKKFRQKQHTVSANIKKSTKNDQLIEMIQMQTSLVYFEDALQNNLEVLSKYRDYMQKEGQDGFADRLYDLYVEADQAATEARIQGKLLENLRDLFSNIVANNLNIVMKVMTSATFVLGIPAIVVGFFGMNVPIPGQKYTWMVFVVTAFTVIFSLTVTWWLKRKDMM